MSTLSIPNTIANGLAANGNNLGANFAAIKAWADSNVLELTGGALTGALTLAGAPTASLHAATKAYVDSGDAAATPADASVTAAKFAAALNRIYVVADATALAALTGMRAGDFAWVTAGSLHFWYTGSAWKIMTPQRGTTTLTFTASITSNTVAVTFPVAFSATPICAVTAIAFTGNTPVAVNIQSVTSTTLNIMARNVQANASGTLPLTGSVTVHWVAYEA